MRIQPVLADYRRSGGRSQGNHRKSFGEEQTTLKPAKFNRPHSRTESMRQFSSASPDRAVDRDFDVLCTTTGGMEPYDSIQMYAQTYVLKKSPENSRDWFQIMKPYAKTIPVEGNVRIIKNIVGHKNASSIPNILKLKAFCKFIGTDYEFLQYIGSGVTNTESAARPFRSLAIVSHDDLRKADVNAPDETIVSFDEYVVLSDSKDNFR